MYREEFGLDVEGIDTDVNRVSAQEGGRHPTSAVVGRSRSPESLRHGPPRRADGSDSVSSRQRGSGMAFALSAPRLSLTDPQATWVARPGLDPFFAYDANYLIENKSGIIIDAVGSRANRAVEIAVTQTMVERVDRRFDVRPRRLAGDTAYGAVRLLKWLGGSQHRTV